jgi:hypothetical protein
MQRRLPVRRIEWTGVTSRSPRRQTTYWDLRAEGGSVWRLRFKAKLEARFVAAQFGKLQLVDSHPILRQYDEPWSQLYFAGTPSDPTRLKRALAEAVAEGSDGWRTVEEYLNRAVHLTKGGLLMRAPRTLIVKAATLLEEAGLTASTIDGAAVRQSRRAVVMDRTFIVARAFRFEDLGAQMKPDRDEYAG